MRVAELLVLLAPLAALMLWRLAVARGLDGPPPRQLLALTVALTLLAGGLVLYAERERLPPGRYVPAQLVDGRIVPGHAAPPGDR